MTRSRFGARSGFGAWVSWASPVAMGALLVASIAALAAGTQNPFIYFRF
jgi:hypothetical protein